MPGPETGSPVGKDLSGATPERETRPERTKESEIKANIELWKGLGVEVDPEDVRAKIEELPEIGGFDWYLYIPEAEKIPKGEDHYNDWQSIGIEVFNDWDELIEDKEDSLAVANIIHARRGQGSYAVTALHIRKSINIRGFTGMREMGYPSYNKWGEKVLLPQFMSPFEWCVAALRMYREENQYLDRDSITYFPDTAHPSAGTSDRMVIGYTNRRGRPTLSEGYSRYITDEAWDKPAEKQIFFARRVITKNTVHREK